MKDTKTFHNVKDAIDYIKGSAVSKIGSVSLFYNSYETNGVRIPGGVSIDTITNQQDRKELLEFIQKYRYLPVSGAGKKDAFYLIKVYMPVL